MDGLFHSRDMIIDIGGLGDGRKEQPKYSGQEDS